MNGQCYVSIPFGRKTSDVTGPIDFDSIYNEVVRPAIEWTGLSTTRGDELGGGIILQGVFRQVLDCDLMIADLTLANPNVIYELGLRHALRPSGTVVIFAAGTQLPYNLSLISAVTYPLVDGQISNGEREDFSKRLARAIEQALSSEKPDSPLYGLLPELLPPTLPQDARATSRAAAVPAGPVIRQQAIESVRSTVEKSTGGVAIDVNPGIPVELYLAELRRTGNQMSIIDFADNLPPEVARQGPVVREVALALRRRDQDADLDRAIDMVEELVEREGSHPETLGVLGRLLKTRYEQSADEQDLTAAIDAYRRAFELDNSTVYFGTSALDLMMTRGDVLKEHEFLGRVRHALESKYENRSYESWDYWDLVSGIELAVHARDWKAAERFARFAAKLTPDDWQIDSVSHQLARVREGMTSGDKRRVSALLQDWDSLRNPS